MNTNLPVATEIIPMVLQLQPAMSTTGYAYALTDDQFYEFCQLNRDFRIERNAAGELVIMPPTGSESDQHNFDVIVQLGIWVKQDGTGVGFGSSGGFTLPNGAVRSPDAAWIKRDRWEAIPPERRKKFAPIGQYLKYQLALEEEQPERLLYLAVPLDTYRSFFTLELPRLLIQRYQVRLIVFDPEEEAIVKWQK
ncbi:element excision factor XisH family protein [Nostoc sp.]